MNVHSIYIITHVRNCVMEARPMVENENSGEPRPRRTRDPPQVRLVVHAQPSISKCICYRAGSFSLIASQDMLSRDYGTLCKQSDRIRKHPSNIFPLTKSKKKNGIENNYITPPGSVCCVLFPLA